MSAEPTTRTPARSKIRRDYESGLSIPRVAETHGVSPRDVRTTLQDAGVPVRRGRPATSITVDDVRKGYATGLNAEQIAHRHGVSKATVAHRVASAKASGDPIAEASARRGAPRRDLDLEALRRDHADRSMTLGALAQRHGVSVSTITKRLHDMGLASFTERRAQEVAAVRSAHEGGKTTEEIAAERGTSVRAVARMLVPGAGGGGRRGGRERISLDLDAITREYVEQRLTLPEVAGRHDVSSATVRARLAEAGVAIRRGRPRKAEA